MIRFTASLFRRQAIRNRFNREMPLIASDVTRLEAGYAQARANLAALSARIDADNERRRAQDIAERDRRMARDAAMIAARSNPAA